jgi:hypothetical protein
MVQECPIAMRHVAQRSAKSPGIRFEQEAAPWGKRIRRYRHDGLQGRLATSCGVTTGRQDSS